MAIHLHNSLKDQIYYYIRYYSGLCLQIPVIFYTIILSNLFILHVLLITPASSALRCVAPAKLNLHIITKDLAGGVCYECSHALFISQVSIYCL